MTNLEPYLVFASIWFVAAATPGADTMLLLTGSLTRGPKSAIALAMGIIVAKVALLAITYFGVSAILGASEVLIQGLKFAGAAFLLFRAFKLWQSPMVTEIKSTAGFIASFGLAFTIAFSNPQALLFYIAVVPQVALETEFLPLSAIIVVGFSFISAVYILLAVPIRAWINQASNRALVSKTIALAYVVLVLVILFR